MLHYKLVILHALLLHISTVLYLSIYSVFTFYPILVCLGWLLITLFFIQYYTVCELFNALNAKLNPICHLLALLGAHHILHVSR